MLARWFILLLVAATLGGCSTPLATPSGQPEVVIRTRSIPAVRSRLIATSQSAGYKLVSDGGESLVFEKPWRGVTAALYQSNVGGIYSFAPDLILSCLIHPEGSSIRLSATIDTRMHTAYGEDKGAMLKRGDMLNELQTSFEQIKTDIEKRR